MADALKTERHPRFWEDLAREIFVTHGLPFLANLGKGQVQRKVEDEVKKKGDKITFGDAMTKLKAKNQNAYDKTVDFMTTHLTSDTDREDFEVNAARTGPAVDDTVAFLEMLAALPDHETREVFLTSLGYLGTRSVDMMERANELRKNFVELIGKASVGTGHGISTAVNETDRQAERLAKKIHDRISNPGWFGRLANRLFR